MVSICQHCSKCRAPEALSNLCKHSPLREDRHPALQKWEFLFHPGAPRKGNSTKTHPSNKMASQEISCGYYMQMRSFPAVFKVCQIVEEAWKRNDIKQGRLAERKGQISRVLLLACLMSEGYMQKACMFFCLMAKVPFLNFI